MPVILNRINIAVTFVRNCTSTRFFRCTLGDAMMLFCFGLVDWDSKETLTLAVQKWSQSRDIIASLRGEKDNFIFIF